MSERIDIDRLARECGARDYYSDFLSGIQAWKFTPGQLIAYTRMVMEECAKACDAEASIEGIAQKCSAAIRRMMP